MVAILIRFRIDGEMEGFCLFRAGVMTLDLGLMRGGGVMNLHMV